MKQVIKQYALEQGALEIQYIEEFFGEFGRKKTATEIVERLQDREHLIHMIEAPLADEPSQVVPVAFKVGHEIRANESIPKLADLVRRLDGAVEFEALSDAEFVLGSAVPHGHDLVLGYYSVHTTDDALRDGEAHIEAIKARLVKEGRLSDASLVV